MNTCELWSQQKKKKNVNGKSLGTVTAHLEGKEQLRY
jgi:hypothetical protein